MKRTETKITTIIGNGCVLNGDFTAAGSVRLDGCVEGNVTVSGQLVLGATGKIHGNVEASSAVLGGEVIGSVKAPEKAELTSTARVIGDIGTNLIVVDAKAIFQGKCDMNQEEAKPAKKRPVRENRAGRKSAKDALKEALREVEEENLAQEKSSAAATAQENSAAKAAVQESSVGVKPLQESKAAAAAAGDTKEEA